MVRTAARESATLLVCVAVSFAASLIAAAIDPDFAVAAGIVAPVILALARASRNVACPAQGVWRRFLHQWLLGWGLIFLLLCELTVSLFAAFPGDHVSRDSAAAWGFAAVCGLAYLALSSLAASAAHGGVSE